MLKERWMMFTAVLLFILGVGFSTILIRQANPEPLDMVAVNRIVKYTEENWMQFDSAETDGLIYSFSVINPHGTLVFQSNPDTASSYNDAVKRQDLIMDLQGGTGYLGKAFINTNRQAWMQQQIRQASFLVLAAFSSLAVVTALFFLYLNHKVLRPFQELGSFARNIAAGNLDIPLTMDKTNLFGSFTEGFDIMREELAKARHQEAMANKSKKELIASLSHDIKTPLTSIKLISELMEATAAVPKEKEKIHTIYEKADQIDRLVTNLFQASLEELDRLSVAITEEESHKLADLIRTADFYNLTSMTPVPACIVRMDPLRMQQVFDNIINNSVKYAGTGIDISFSLISEFLKINIKDYGPGVSEDEIPLLFQKYYRGSKAVEDQKDGSGIGLYICSYLIGQMGGRIQCGNHENGFVVELLIPLA